MSCLAGLEGLLEREVISLGLRCDAVISGGVELRANASQLRSLKRCSGVAAHVLVRLLPEPVRVGSMRALEREASRMPWNDWLAGLDRECVRFVVVSHASTLWHQGAIAERLARAARVKPVKAEGAKHTLVVRVERDMMMISLNEESEALYRRGYRLASGAAPLREDIAHALVKMAEWNDEQELLLDPFCGSGTIAIEAAMIAQGIAPGSLRFGPAASTAAPVDAAKVFASDRDSGAITMSSENAARIGAKIDLQACSFSAHPLLADSSQARVLVACNPPYGRRLATDATLFQKLGAIIRRSPGKRRLALLCANPHLARATGLPLKKLFLCTQGGHTVGAYVSLLQ